MAKMVANKYYTKGGVEKINGYFVSISKKIIEEADFDVDAQIKIKTEKDTLIELQKQEIERLHSIIKEVREYIESYLPNYDFDKTNLKKLLEILKGSDK